MRPAAAMPSEMRRAVQAVLLDIDDTLSTDGRLTAAAYEALERLADAGLRVVPVTGRPAGWCDMIARFWPVDAVVGENGAFWFRYDRRARRMHRRMFLGEDTRPRLDALAREILAAVPGAALAADQPYRLADLAIDFAEDVGPLGRAEIDRIVALFEAAGARAKVSSIHVNGWFGDWDKLATAWRLLEEVFAIDVAEQKNEIVFVGDSPNDEPMFAFFPNAVGVANLRRFAPRMKALPAWITEREAGAGFVELAELLLEARR
ncbi:MAG: HAD-IIB family hydrolase [Rhodospirillales bacterium]|nr:HAD-IIB family hydrolase [Rhodospirillales bacterium]